MLRFYWLKKSLPLILCGRALVAPKHKQCYRDQLKHCLRQDSKECRGRMVNGQALAITIRLVFPVRCNSALHNVYWRCSLNYYHIGP